METDADGDKIYNHIDFTITDNDNTDVGKIGIISTKDENSIKVYIGNAEGYAFVNGKDSNSTWDSLLIIALEEMPTVQRAPMVIELDYIRRELYKQEWYKHIDFDANVIETYPDNIIGRARDLLMEGDALKFILDTWNNWHIGDRSIGEVCACAVASTYIHNSKGLHIKPSGESGKGKSDAVKKFINLLPKSKYLMGSLSGKSMFYNPNLKEGTIIFTDDANLNEDIVTTIKTATTNYQSITQHHTVKKQAYEEYEIPGRISWWMTSVDGFDDDQMGNRFLGTDVDCTAEQDQRVLQSQMLQAMLGTTDNEPDEDVYVCRCVYDILGASDYKIVCPFAFSIKWANAENRRNFLMFIDILTSVTLYNIFQRTKFEDAYLTTVDDFECARHIYKNLAESNATNLDEDELKIMRFLSQPDVGEVDIKTIGNVINKSRQTATKKMRGRDGNGGLLAKVTGLNVVKSTIRENEEVSTSKIFYTYTGNVGLSSFSDVVSLDMDTFDDSIKLFKQTYTDYKQKGASGVGVTPCNPNVTPMQPVSNPSTIYNKYNKTLSVDSINIHTSNQPRNDIEPCKEIDVTPCNTHSEAKVTSEATDSDKGGYLGVTPPLHEVTQEDLTKRLRSYQRSLNPSGRIPNYEQFALIVYNQSKELKGVVTVEQIEQLTRKLAKDGWK